MAKSKDPATLWYWNDWIGGTLTLTRQAKGAYMDLLTAQFNSGHLTETQIKTLLGTDQGLWGTVLREKFLVDGDGKYYNKRLDDEIQRRANFSKNQADRIKKRWSKSRGNTAVYTGAVPIETETENRNENSLKDGGVGEGLIFDAEAEILKNQIEFERICMVTGIKKEKSKEHLRKYHLYLTENEKYPRTKKSVFAGFEKWLLNEKNFNRNGSHQQISPVGDKPGTSEARINRAKDW